MKRKERKRGRKNKTYVISDLVEIARKRGGECLSTQFKTVKDKYTWKCAEGHEWEASFNNIHYGKTWCMKCGGNETGTIKEMEMLAKDKGGRCLSKIYINEKTKLNWECKEGHRWWATPDSIKNKGSWCRICSGVPLYTIEAMKKLANERGGECLSENYINYSEPMAWKCKLGHIWETPAKYILKGHWCHECNMPNPKDLNDLVQIAAIRGGKLLSKTYKGMGASYEWQCEKGHRWWAPAGAVQGGRWCHQCRKWSIEEFQKIAEEKGGRCLSEQYINCSSPLEFICKEGHVFSGIPTNVKRKDAWCIYCNNSIGEEKVRLIFETLMGKKFIRTRSILGDNLEIDGYNDDDPKNLIGFEYQGEQHYHFIPYFHTNPDGFLHQILSDLETKNRSEDLGISLIIIPYTAKENMVEFIKGQMIERNIKFNDVEINLNKVYQLKSRKEQYQEIAQQRNGKLLSTCYKDHKTKLEFECESGHKFKLLPYKVRKLGKWCKECNKDILRRKQMEKIIQITKNHGGKCLTDSYLNNKSILKFECELGHRWEQSAAVILKGQYWCPICSKDRTKKVG